MNTFSFYDILKESTTCFSQFTWEFILLFTNLMLCIWWMSLLTNIFIFNNLTDEIDIFIQVNINDDDMIRYDEYNKLYILCSPHVHQLGIIKI